MELLKVKNIAVYITPKKEYDREVSKVIKIFLDNSWNLGWKKEDVILINNFPWSYGDFKSTVVSDDNFVPFRPGSSKTVSVANLFEKGFFKENEIYWVHDPDAFELEKIEDEEIRNLLEYSDVGFTDYGTSKKFSLGSYFFKSSAKDIFLAIRDNIYDRQSRGLNAEDENSLVELFDNNWNGINKRIKNTGIKYNFGTRKLKQKFEIAEKPIKVLHFRPFKKGLLDIYVYGKNELGFPIMNDRLKKIFRYHGVV